MSDEQKVEDKPQENNQPQEQNQNPENSPTNEQPENQNQIPENQNQEVVQQQEQQHQEQPNQQENQPNQPENQNQQQQNEEQNMDQEEENEEEEAQEEQPPNAIAKVDEKDKNKYNKRGIEDIQRQIQEMAKKIEHEKINLRITTERLTQKEKTYNELQGKPVNKTNEEKERERKEHKKAVKNHKLSDPIIRKKGKEKEFYDEQIKNQKAYDKSKTDFEKLTCDINELVIGNKDLKQQIIDLRKRKVEAL